MYISHSDITTVEVGLHIINGSRRNSQARNSWFQSQRKNEWRQAGAIHQNDVDRWKLRAETDAEIVEDKAKNDDEQRNRRWEAVLRPEN